MKPHPVEVVVIRQVVRPALAPPPCDEPARPEPDELVGPVQFSPDQQRDLGGLAELVRCPVRQAILLALACGGETNVGGLAGRTSIPQKTITHHLHDLRSAGLVISRRCGKQIFNALAASGPASASSRSTTFAGRASRTGRGSCRST